MSIEHWQMFCMITHACHPGKGWSSTEGKLGMSASLGLHQTFTP